MGVFENDPSKIPWEPPVVDAWTEAQLQLGDFEARCEANALVPDHAWVNDLAIPEVRRPPEDASLVRLVGHLFRLWWRRLWGSKQQVPFREGNENKKQRLIQECVSSPEGRAKLALGMGHGSQDQAGHSK